MAPSALLATGQAIARNVAPLAGVLFLGWNARNVLYLYFVDTLFAMAVIIAGLTRHFSPPIEDDGWAARLNGEVGPLAGGLFVAAFMAVPLGIWFVFLLDGDLALAATLADPAFATAVAWQALAALSSYVSLVEALRVRTPEALHLKRRFALVFLRWIALIFVSQFLVPLPGPYALVAMVAAYAALSIWTEIAPDHFLATMPGGNDAPEARTPVAGSAPDGRRSRRRGKRR